MNFGTLLNRIFSAFAEKFGGVGVFRILGRLRFGVNPELNAPGNEVQISLDA